MVCDNIEVGCDETQANDFDGIAAKRSHLIGQELDFRSAARLLMANDEHSIRQPQCRDLGKCDMTRRQPFALYTAVRVEKHEVCIAHGVNKHTEPLPAQ